jgi:hypothetical protein
VKRHPDLESVTARRIDIKRMQGASKDTLNAWFNAFKATVAEFKISNSDIYNMDETGFSIGSMASTKVIVDSTVKSKWQANPGRQEWISIVECICADGTAIDPFIIFKGKNVSQHWISEDIIPDTWSFSANSNGWTSNTLGLEWLSSVFEPKTRAKAEGKTRLLICDGHDSHINGFFISFCMANDTQLLILPPHTSHMLQPLDVAIFGPLKRALTTAMMPLHEARLERIQKAEWLEAYNKARENCFTSRNISSAWRGAGLIPFDQKRVERNLHIEKTVEPSQAQTAPQTPNKRIYDKLLITSSSPEFGEF